MRDLASFEYVLIAFATAIILFGISLPLSALYP
jgi:hypothetical protein